MPLDVIRTPVGTVARRAGGTAANVCAIMAFLGWDAALAGQAGRDVAGAELIVDLASVGVETGQIERVPGAQTARVVHVVRPDGHFYSYSCPKCGSGFPRSRPLTLEAAVRCAQRHPKPTVFYFDRANAGTVTLAERYANAGSVVVFEPSTPANADLLGRAAAVADVIKHSDDRSVGGLDDLRVRPRKGQLRIVTHGAEGLELRIGAGRARRFPALATLAVDTGGAGDWTTAGFLTRAVTRSGLDHARLEQAVRFGQALAAVNCAVVGARGLMGMTRDAAVRRARRCATEGGLTTALRVKHPVLPPHPGGLCQSCLMPVAEQLILDNAEAAVISQY
jgi:fructokinase